jgi:uncharacterized protein involved in exopolysaccharide biosynthesis
MESRFPDGDHEQGIDLRRYIGILRRRWLLILAATVLAAASAFLFSKLQAPTYEATALVVVGKPRYVLNFDPLIEGPEAMTIGGTALATLATADEVLQQVLAEVQEVLPRGERTLRALKRTLKAVADRDPSLLKLTVRGTDPAVVAELANTWALAFITHINRVYGVSGENISFFQTQAERTREELDEAERNLVAYQAQNELPALEAQHSSLLSSQAQYLTEQRRIEGLLQDMETLRAQLGEQPATTPLTLDDQLAVLGVSLESLSVQASIPVELQLGDTNVLTDRSVAEALTYLETLQDNLRAKQVDLDRELADMGPSLQELQERIESLRGKERRLEQARDIARETYYAVVRELEEARIAVEDTANRARVGSTAAVPERAIAPRPLTNTALAAVAGLMVGVVAAFLLEYLGEGRQPGGVRERAVAPEAMKQQAGKRET